MTVPLPYALGLSAVLFGVGLLGLLTRQNALVLVIGVELMLNAANINFVAASYHWGAADGQLFAIAVIALAAAEVAVGIGILLQVHRTFGTVDVTVPRALRW